MPFFPDDPKEGLAAHAAGKAVPQAVHDAEWDYLGTVTLEMPVAGRSSRVGVIQRQFAIDGAGNLQLLKLVFVGNNNNKTRLQQFTFAPDGTLLHQNVIRFGHTDDLNSNDLWKGDGFAACGRTELEVYADTHQIPGVNGFNRAGMGGTPDGAPFIIPGVWVPVAGGATVAFLPWPTPVEGQQAFSDVVRGNTFWPEAQIAAALGIAGGHPDGTLGAKEQPDKLHVLAMIVRAAHAVYTLLAGGDTHTTAGKGGK